MPHTPKQAEFESQYNDVFPYVYRYVLYRVPHLQDAEDIVSEVFMQAYKQIEQFDPERGNLRQWITGVMKRKIVDFWRKRKIVFELDEALLLIDAVDPQGITATLDHTMAFERVMDKLSPHMKALFAMRYLDGLTYEEISELIDKKPEAVRKLFSRMHHKLRLQLSEQLA